MKPVRGKHGCPANLPQRSEGKVSLVTQRLPRRDRELMVKIHEFLGPSIILSSADNLEEKRQAYAADVVWQSNNEFGFDYLRTTWPGVLTAVQQIHYAINDR